MSSNHGTHTDRPPVWDAVETDRFALAEDRRPGSSREGAVRREVKRISVAAAATILAWTAIWLAADPAASAVIAGLVGLFFYLGQDGR
jgi:hypothetical protein